MPRRAPAAARRTRRRRRPCVRPRLPRSGVPSTVPSIDDAGLDQGVQRRCPRPLAGSCVPAAAMPTISATAPAGVSVAVADRVADACRAHRLRRWASLPMSAISSAPACAATSATVAGADQQGGDVGEVEPGRAASEQIRKRRPPRRTRPVVRRRRCSARPTPSKCAEAGRSATRWAITETAWLALRPDGEIDAPSAATASSARHQLLRDQRRQRSPRRLRCCPPGERAATLPSIISPTDSVPASTAVAGWPARSA